MCEGKQTLIYRKKIKWHNPSRKEYGNIYQTLKNMGTLISIIPILESILIRGVYKDWFQNNCSVVNYNELKT